jgi:hypothetical protein
MRGQRLNDLPCCDPERRSSHHKGIFFEVPYRNNLSFNGAPGQQSFTVDGQYSAGFPGNNPLLGRDPQLTNIPTDAFNIASARGRRRWTCRVSQWAASANAAECWGVQSNRYRYAVWDPWDCVN